MPRTACDQRISSDSLSYFVGLQPLGEDSAFESLSKALEGATLEAFDCSGRALLKSTRARASHHGRADMLSMHDSMSTNHTEPLAMVCFKQQDSFATASKQCMRRNNACKCSHLWRSLLEFMMT